MLMPVSWWLGKKDVLLEGEVSQHLERITVAVLGQEILTKSALEMALLPILLGTWEEERGHWQKVVLWEKALGRS